jgi:hypothetical protein
MYAINKILNFSCIVMTSMTFSVINGVIMTVRVFQSADGQALAVLPAIALSLRLLVPICGVVLVIIALIHLIFAIQPKT